MSLKSFKAWKLSAVAALAGMCSGCAMPCLCVPSIPLPHFGANGFGLERTMSIPDMVPLGAISRAHWHTMETNAEASDFVFHRNEFVDDSTELSPYGRDHIAEVAARMSSAPFPILVQRSMNNADPELDAARRNLIVQVLTDLGNPDADQRTVVSQPYSDGMHALEGESDYSRFRNSRGNINGGNQNNGNAGGGF